MPDEYLSSLSESDRSAMWRQWLADTPRARCSRLIAESIDGDVVGFVLAGPSGGDVESDVGEVYALNVDPDHWAMGAGSALLDAATSQLAIDGFTSGELWVHRDNNRARRFYVARGWVPDQQHRCQIVFGAEIPEIRYVLQELGAAG